MGICSASWRKLKNNMEYRVSGKPNSENDGLFRFAIIRTNTKTRTTSSPIVKTYLFITLYRLRNIIGRRSSTEGGTKCNNKPKMRCSQKKVNQGKYYKNELNNASPVNCSDLVWTLTNKLLFYFFFNWLSAKKRLYAKNLLTM